LCKCVKIPAQTRTTTPAAKAAFLIVCHVLAGFWVMQRDRLTLEVSAAVANVSGVLRLAGKYHL